MTTSNQTEIHHHHDQFVQIQLQQQQPAKKILTKMENTAEIRMNNSLEPIPEETGLPRISQLIPKSPETRKREQEYRQLYDDLLSNQKQRIEIFYEMLVVNRNLKRISHNGPCIMGNYTDCGSV